MIKKVSLEEILKIENLKNKEYSVKIIESNVFGNVISIELQCIGIDEHNLYVCSQLFDVKEQTSRLCLDEEGLPYYEVRLGPVTYQSYERIFVGNTCYADAVFGRNQMLIDEVFLKIKKENHFVYHEFMNYLENLINLLPNIINAKIKDYFLKNNTEMDAFSDLDLEILNCLLTRLGPDENLNNLERLSQQTKNMIMNAMNDIFRVWYHNYLILRGYEDRIDEEGNNASEALKKWVGLEMINLELNEFKRVREFTMI